MIHIALLPSRNVSVCTHIDSDWGQISPYSLTDVRFCQTIFTFSHLNNEKYLIIVIFIILIISDVKQILYVFALFNFFVLTYFFMAFVMFYRYIHFLIYINIL